jgi:alpha-mannosidase
VRPEADQIPGACKNWFTVQRFVDISNDKYGVTWLTPDAPLVQVGGVTANLIGSLSDTRAWKNRIEPSTAIYSWAMNNHWHTNYRAEQEGPTVFRYVLWPHGREADTSKAAWRALEYSQPLVVLPARGQPPTTSPLRVFASGGAEGFQVTALKPSDDGKALILRLFGASGRDGQAQLQWTGAAPKATWLSDTSERPIQPVTGPVPLPAWSIVTVRADLP